MTNVSGMLRPGAWVWVVLAAGLVSSVGCGTKPVNTTAIAIGRDGGSLTPPGRPSGPSGPSGPNADPVALSPDGAGEPEGDR